MTTNKTLYQQGLAQEILRDIEGGPSVSRSILMKAARLAESLGDAETARWLRFELTGYPDGDLEADRLREGVGRNWTLPQIPGGTMQKPSSPVTESLTTLESRIPALSARLHKLHESAPFAYLQQNSPQSHQIQAAANALNVVTGIRDRVLTKIHEYVTAVFHRLSFREMAYAIFEVNRSRVDSLLRDVAPEVLQKISAIDRRLAEGDTEAVSQALSSCRRMITAFADAVYPPRAEPVASGDGTEHELKQSNVLNRIHQFLNDRCKSASRRDRLNRTIRGLYDRVSAGMKTEIDIDEARSLFLLTYLTLGEISGAPDDEEHLAV